MNAVVRMLRRLGVAGKNAGDVDAYGVARGEAHRMNEVWRPTISEITDGPGAGAETPLEREPGDDEAQA